MQTIRLLTAAVFAIAFAACRQKTNFTKQSSSSQKENQQPTDPVKNSYDQLRLSDYSQQFLEQNTETFNVSGKKVISGKKGLKITVDPSALEKIDGSPVDGDIQVTMIELTNSEDLFRSNAATVSDNRLLVSGGSYFIKMICNGTELKIKNGYSLPINFPRLSENEMQLFYGQRDHDGNMNWKEGGTPLLPPALNDSDSYRRFRLQRPSTPVYMIDTSDMRFYRSLNDHVFYYERYLTINQLINELKQNCIDIRVDTIYMWPKNLPKQVLDTGYLVNLYGPQYQYRLLKGEDLRRQREIEKRNKELLQTYQQDLDKYYEKLTQKLIEVKNYYQPAEITALGWINCDRFFKCEQTDVPVDLPVTMKNNDIEYFVIFKDITSVVSGNIIKTQDASILPGLPIGRPVRIVAFTKYNGIMYHGVNDFTVKKGIKVPLDFKAVTNDEMKKIFNGNAGI